MVAGLFSAGTMATTGSPSKLTKYGSSGVLGSGGASTGGASSAAAGGTGGLASQASQYKNLTIELRNAMPPAPAGEPSSGSAGASSAAPGGTAGLLAQAQQFRSLASVVGAAHQPDPPSQDDNGASGSGWHKAKQTLGHFAGAALATLGLGDDTAFTAPATPLASASNSGSSGDIFRTSPAGAPATPFGTLVSPRGSVDYTNTRQTPAMPITGGVRKSESGDNSHSGPSSWTGNNNLSGGPSRSGPSSRPPSQPAAASSRPSSSNAQGRALARPEQDMTDLQLDAVLSNITSLSQNANMALLMVAQDDTIDNNIITTLETLMTDLEKAKGNVKVFKHRRSRSR